MKSRHNTAKLVGPDPRRVPARARARQMHDRCYIRRACRCARRAPSPRHAQWIGTKRLVCRWRALNHDFESSRQLRHPELAERLGDAGSGTARCLRSRCHRPRRRE